MIRSDRIFIRIEVDGKYSVFWKMELVFLFLRGVFFFRKIIYVFFIEYRKEDDIFR